MGEVKVYLSEDLDKRFRRAAMDSYGYGRGSISKAAQEALLEWCRKHETVEPVHGQGESTMEKTGEKTGSSRSEKNEQAQRVEGKDETPPRPQASQGNA